MAMECVASSVLAFRDTGKTKVTLPVGVDIAICEAIADATKAWTCHRKAEDRDPSAALRRLDRLRQTDKPRTVRDAAFAIMADAYAKASEDGKLPANARQIMYAARPLILSKTGAAEFDDAYLHKACSWTM